MTQVALKPYPCGVVLHALIDACLENRELIRKSESITVVLHPLAIERTDRPEPRDVIEARLSAPHAVAACALRGRAGIAEFEDLGAELAAFRKRVRIVRDESLDKMAAAISAGGRTIRAPAAKPLDGARLEAKLRELAGARAEPWLRFVSTLESTATVSLPD